MSAPVDGGCWALVGSKRVMRGAVRGRRPHAVGIPPGDTRRSTDRGMARSGLRRMAGRDPAPVNDVHPRRRLHPRAGPAHQRGRGGAIWPDAAGLRAVIRATRWAPEHTVSRRGTVPSPPNMRLVRRGTPRGARGDAGAAAGAAGGQQARDTGCRCRGAMALIAPVADLSGVHRGPVSASGKRSLIPPPASASAGLPDGP